MAIRVARRVESAKSFDEPLANDVKGAIAEFKKDFEKDQAAA